MRKVIQYIVSNKCARHLWISGIIWFIIGILPPIIGAIAYPTKPIFIDNTLPQVLNAVVPQLGWQFWMHRVAVDPLTKSIGAVPMIFLMILIAMRIYLMEIVGKTTTIETIFKAEGSPEAHDGFWGWETKYKRISNKDEELERSSRKIG